MMQVSLVIPLFTVPQAASHKKIIQEIRKFTGFNDIILNQLEPIIKPDHKKENVKQLCAEVRDMELTMGQIADILEKVSMLERENQVLRKDLASFYCSYQENTKKIVSKAQKIEKAQQKPKDHEQSHQKSQPKQYSYQNQHQIQEFQQQIQKLVTDKRSKQQIIQKLTLYCECLLKIIENKKLPIF